MTALVRMRLAAFARTGRLVAPLLIILIIIGVIYGGGQSDPAEAYGFSALVLFPALAWQTKLLLDAEPDVQRRLAAVVLGSPGRELAAGLLAAAVAALVPVVLALALPWAVGGIAAKDVGLGIVLGLWAHALVVPPAIGLGAWSSRAVAGSPGRAVAILGSGVVLCIVLGLHNSPVPWLAPPVMGVSRTLASGIDRGQVVEYTAWALIWSAVVLAGYGMARRRQV